MTLFVDDPDFQLYVGDALEVVRDLPAESVHCCVTSPPYWGLRDYGTDGQLGLEDTPDAYVANMVAVFREVRRVLRRDGTCWLNIGSSYSAQEGQRKATDKAGAKQQTKRGSTGSPSRAAAGFKPKDMVPIPWLLGLALQADGWYLRSDIIWSKPNPMPESVTDRPTKAHEYLFLLTRSPRYFYDADAIREEHQFDGRKKVIHDHAVNGSHDNYANMGTAQERWPNGGRNKRSVWSIATESFAEAHFATFPQALVEPCVLAGTSERGCCPECGAPWEREIEKTGWPDPAVVDDDQGRMKGGGNVATDTQRRKELSGAKHAAFKAANPDRLIGWRPTCDHDHEPIACVVLDPFLGSGTTALVARRLGRKTIGIELSAEYAALAAERLQQLSLFADA